MSRGLGILLIAVVLTACSLPAEEGAGGFGPLALEDIAGQPHAPLEDPGPDRWTALFFVRSDCPISNQYAPEIKRICTEYGDDGVRCFLVYSDRSMTPDAVEEHLAEFGYTIPAVLDLDHALVLEAGASITPEAAVFSRGGNREYRGRIDNLYADLGRPRQRVSETDLKNALDDLVAGRTVRNPETQATGCFIE